MLCRFCSETLWVEAGSFGSWPPSGLHSSSWKQATNAQGSTEQKPSWRLCNSSGPCLMACAANDSRPSSERCCRCWSGKERLCLPKKQCVNSSSRSAQPQPIDSWPRPNARARSKPPVEKQARPERRHHQAILLTLSMSNLQDH